MRDNLMRQIQAVSFAMDELRLFIDTHPCNTEAIALFNKYAAERKELIERYNDEVSPIGGYCPENGDSWRWGCDTAWRGGEC